MNFQNSKKIILAITTTLALGGCMGIKNPIQKEQPIPSWYLNSPANTQLFIYGEGEAKTLEEAKNNALNSMASKLVVSVGSSMQTKTTIQRGMGKNSYSKDVTKDLKVDVQKIKFTNAKVVKSVKIGDNFYILMKVNRIELFKNKKIEFEILDKRVTTQFNSLNNYPVLEQIKILKTLYPDIIEAKKKAIILNAINNQFDYKPFIEKYDSYIDKINALKNDSTIKVETNSNSKYFADSLIELLNQEQYKISSNNNADIVIKINNKIKYSIARGWNIAKVATTLSVISNGKIVSNRTIQTVGRSSTSKGSALENASQSFVKKIKQEGLDKIIFGK